MEEKEFNVVLTKYQSVHNRVKIPMPGLDSSCISFPSFSHIDVLELGNAPPNSQFHISTREYPECPYEIGGKIQHYPDPFGEYIEKPLLQLYLSSQEPSHGYWAHRFDILKEFLNTILSNFNLSLCYLHFCEGFSQDFDRLLRR